MSQLQSRRVNNSGIFIRCHDSEKITDKSCYEVNIFDQRKDPTYGTGGIVNFAEVDPMPKAGGKWNTFEIYRGVAMEVYASTVCVCDWRRSGGFDSNLDPRCSSIRYLTIKINAKTPTNGGTMTKRTRASVQPTLSE